MVRVCSLRISRVQTPNNLSSLTHGASSVPLRAAVPSVCSPRLTPLRSRFDVRSTSFAGLI